MAIREHPERGLDLIRSKVDGFRKNLLAIRAASPSEASLRLEYLDHFWSALGWDVGNLGNASPDKKEVVIEAISDREEGDQRHNQRPDYVFRIDGAERFIVEAKKAALDLTRDAEAIFQTKSYAWSRQIPFAILTDFEELRLFDTTLEPHFDEPMRGLVPDFDLRFEDYLPQWDVLVATLGRDAVTGGSLEALLAKLKRIRSGRRIRGIDRNLFELRGTEPVDRDFLALLEGYRVRFAQEMFTENRAAFPDADTHHGAARLTEATQRLIDRLVFVRVCEDRGVEVWGTLRGLVDRAVRDGDNLYELLCARFRSLDRDYNGYLFKPHFGEQLKISPQLLADFIANLYPPRKGYRFDAIGDDILGIVYERFLGSVITVKKNRVDAVEKPEVRHAGGVYYTPRFVVDTIIRRVVGPKINGLMPAQVLNVRILDPACGSGSFLIAAFQYLIDHCVRYVEEHPEAAEIPASPRARKRKNKIAFKDNEGQWHLAPEFRADLLTSCLYGVDIDAQAVEVTIMSLYLKMLEEKLPPDWQREWLDSQLLPTLDNNIRCGNSLLSQTDFDRWWEAKHASLFSGDEEVRFRMNPFDWTSQTRGFGRILDGGQGFDCIIGNPPYIRVQELNQWAPDECDFYKWNYKCAAKGNYDIYVVFIEKALQLLGPDGLLGFICPHKFWQATYGEGIRGVIADGKHLRGIVDFGDQQVFAGATTYTAVHTFAKTAAPNGVDYAKVIDLQDGQAQCAMLDTGRIADGCERFAARHPSGNGPWVFANAAGSEWLDAVRANHPTLGMISEKIAQGIVTSDDDVFFLHAVGKQYLSDATGKRYELERAVVHPLLKGAVHMKRWLPLESERAVLFPYEEKDGKWQLIPAERLAAQYPMVWGYLNENRERLEARESGKMSGKAGWYGYVYPKNLDVMARPKILVPAIGTRAEYCLDLKGRYHYVGSGGGGGGGHAILTGAADLCYVCALLNSKLLDAFLQRVTTPFHSGWFAYSKAYIAQIPIKLPETADEKKTADKIVDRVKEIIDLKKRLQAGGMGDNERSRLEIQVESGEKQIDEWVCRLYGVDAVPAD